MAMTKALTEIWSYQHVLERIKYAKDVNTVGKMTLVSLSASAILINYNLYFIRTKMNRTVA